MTFMKQWIVYFKKVITRTKKNLNNKSSINKTMLGNP